MSSDPPRYSPPAIIIHWCTALLVFGMFGLGWYMVDLPRGETRHFSFSLHKSIGITIFALLVVRLAWRLRRPPPPLPVTMARWQRIAARVTHLLFYVLLALQPLSGYLSSSFTAYSTKYFGVPLPDWGANDPPLNELFTEIHVICSVALFITICVHVLGAFKHLLTPGDAVFQRMWPIWLRSGPRRSG